MKGTSIQVVLSLISSYFAMNRGRKKNLPLLDTLSSL
jgi:hypothetical protein